MPVLIDVVTGAGDNWTIEPAIERHVWLDNNVGKDNYSSWWGDRWSDKLFIDFKNDDDAILYKLKWIQNGRIK